MAGKVIIACSARATPWERTIGIQLLDGDLGSVLVLARKLGLSFRYLIRIWASSPPNLVEDLLEGKQSAGLTLESLRRPAPSGLVLNTGNSWASLRANAPDTVLPFGILRDVGSKYLKRL